MLSEEHEQSPESCNQLVEMWGELVRLTYVGEPGFLLLNDGLFTIGLGKVINEESI